MPAPSRHCAPASVSDLSLPVAKDLGARFNVVGFVPTLSAVLIVLVVVWSGAPQDAPSYHRASEQAASLSGGEWAALGFLMLVIVLATHPIQLSLVRLLEGYPQIAPLRSLLERRRRRHVERMKALRRTAGDETAAAGDRRAAAEALRFAYPPETERVLPTRLGNVLRASEDRAGEYYGWTTVAIWPRLYMLLPDHAAALVEDARNQLDSSCRFAVSFTLAALVLLGLLVQYPVWLLLAMVPAVMARLSYEGAVAGARRYGLAVQAAFDLYRLDLLEAMHLPLPDDAEAELVMSRKVSEWLTQGSPHGLAYKHGNGDG